MTSAAPEGFHTITPRIVVDDAEALVGFLRDVFGATGDFTGDGPAQIRIGDSLLMISTTAARETFPAFLYVYVEDVDDTYQRALAAGALSVETVWNTPYGDRRGMVKDRWGNVWQIATQRAR